jgi:hypothetical protein
MKKLIILSILISILVIALILFFSFDKNSKNQQNNLVNESNIIRDSNLSNSEIQNYQPLTYCTLKNGTEIICQRYQECYEYNCLLMNHSKKLGVIYLYESENTYNPTWRHNLIVNINKIEEALLNITNNKANYSLTILGEIKTDDFCWNPAFLGVNLTQRIIKKDSNTKKIISEDIINTIMPLPGSGFGTRTIIIDSTKKIKDNKLIIEEIVNLELNCPSCKIYYRDRTKEFQDIFLEDNFLEVNTTHIEIDCKNNIVDEKFNETKLLNLKLKASKSLGFELTDFDEIILIFGKSGRILPYESKENLHFRCKTSISFIGGYSHLIFAENEFISQGDYVDCFKEGYGGIWYEPVGWHIFVHEFLHPLGAVDIYDVGTTFGYESPAYHRNEALKIDNKADQSIMGNSERECKQLSQKTKNDECSKEELEKVYLDSYNKKRMGLD